MKKPSFLAKNDKRQLLIESTEFISSIKLSKELKEAVQMSNGKAGTLIVKNIPCTILNRINQNGRIYSTAVVQQALDNAKTLHLFEQKQLLSQADEHPDSSFVAPSHASHVVINAYIKPKVKIFVEGKEEVQDVLFMDWEILNTQEGKNLRALFEAECSVGTSIRGVGDMNGKQVENYDLLGVDCVGNPSSSTFTRMPVSESVKVELKDPRQLKETFTVSTSSTNVVKDLEAAAAVQERLDSIGYGTVTKTSTKVDEETDPKTGAQTSITTLEAETSDDVANLDQALSMAKNAMLNGVVNVDSITIENIKEEQPQESTDKEEAPLNEEDHGDDTEQYGKCGWCGEEFPLSDLKKEKDFGYLCNTCAKAIASREGDDSLDFEESEYIPESEMPEANSTEVNMTEAKEDEKKDPKEGRKFVLKTPSGFVAMDGNALVFKEDPKEALHFVSGKEESGLIHLSGVEKILDAMGVYEVEKYYRKNTTDISAPNEIATNSETAEVQSQETSVDEAKLTEQGDSRFVAEVTTYGPGNAPEITTIPVSAIEPEALHAEISNLWEMKSQKSRDRVDIRVYDTTNGRQLNYNPTKDGFDDLGITNNKYARRTEVSNVTEAGEIEQKGNELSIDLNKDNKATKNFDSVAQASVVKAGLEKGKLDGNVMLDEAGTPIEVDLTVEAYDNAPYTLWFKCDDSNFNLLDADLKKLYDKKIIWNWNASETMPNVLYVNRLTEKECNILLDALRKAGNKLVEGDFVTTSKEESIEEANTPKYEDIKPGWYIGAEGVGISGPYDSKEEAIMGLEEYTDAVEVHYIAPEDLEEVVYANPSEPSDTYVQKPLEDSINEAEAEVTVSDIDWDEDSVFESVFGESEDKTEEDLLEAFDNLPEQMTFKVDVSNLDDPQEVKRSIYNEIEKQTGKKVRNANIVNIR